MEEVLRAEEAPWGVGLHAQEPVQKTGGLSTFSSRTSLWYNGQRLYVIHCRLIQPIPAWPPSAKITH